MAVNALRWVANFYEREAEKQLDYADKCAFYDRAASARLMQHDFEQRLEASKAARRRK